MKIAKETAKKILIILLIVFGGLTLVGGSVFTIAMAAAGWDFTVMNNVEYVYHEYTECLDELGEIPDELKEEAPVEAEDADEVEKVETEEDSAIGSGTISEA